uniref:Uncharacterized protein n=1 Tax=viral metagenome TaxID=1070528 RepID=A0A6M3KMT3_9ZZZZ
MAVKDRAQIGLEDTWVRDAELEELLEDREVKKERLAEYREADKKARDKIAALEQPMPYRCGRFVINKTVLGPRAVEFETEGGERLSIKLAEK